MAEKTEKIEAMYEKYQNEFGIRLSKLRMQKDVSARDMSLSIGQNPGYINSIENGKSLPSMKNFFYICDYLNITPNDFFKYELSYPQRINKVIDYLVEMDDEKFGHISAVIEDLTK